MPSSLLFAINNEGRVHTLSTTGQRWRELPYCGQEFKKLSAVPHFLWALGGDYQVYVYVHGLDIPIRVREEMYENERWLPVEGFSPRLLPTDRYHFSSACGTQDRSRDLIRLPSMAWQWEGDWRLELTLDGQPLDHNGWTYAVDFPATYHAKKQWKSCVRRRLWVRGRKYGAMGSWCAIAPLHKDATQEPFIDIGIGGQRVDVGVMVVWAVTSNNRVMFRSGVSTRLPEGARWQHVPTPTGCEVDQVSVGGAGALWAALRCGRALVRVGVSRDCLVGTGWVEVGGPSPGVRICHLTVGGATVGVGGGGQVRGAVAVWAVTQDKRTWFRKGVEQALVVTTAAAGQGGGGDRGKMEEAEVALVGTGWLEMVGRMCMISVSANNQVFGVGSDDRAIYYRAGVLASSHGNNSHNSGGDLTGKRWKQLLAPLQVSRTSSNATLHSHRSTTSLDRPNSLGGLVTSSDAASASPPTTTGRHHHHHHHQHHQLLLQSEQCHSAPTLVAPTSLPPLTSSGSGTSEGGGRHHYETQLKNPKAWSPVRSVGSVVGHEVLSDESVWHADRGEVSIYAEDEDLGWSECDSRWSWVEVGACTIDPHQLPSWLADLSTNTSSCVDQPWRRQILEELRSAQRSLQQRFDVMDNTNINTNNTCNISNSSRNPSISHSSIGSDGKTSAIYQLAVDSTAWTHTGEARLVTTVTSGPTAGSSNKDGGSSGDNVTYVDCVLQLELDTGGGGGNTLTVLTEDGASILYQFVMEEVTCVQCCSEPGVARLSLHTPNLTPSMLRLQFTTDMLLDEWLAQLNKATHQQHTDNSDSEVINSRAIWATTTLGDIFVCDTNLPNVGPGEINEREIDLFSHKTPFTTPLHCNCVPGTIITFTCNVLESADRISFNLHTHKSHSTSHSSSRSSRLLLEAPQHDNIAFHLNPRLKDKCLVRNSQVGGKWGEEERTCYKDEEQVPGIRAGEPCTVRFLCRETDVIAYLEGREVCTWRWRGGLTGGVVCQLGVVGDLEPFKVKVATPGVMVLPRQLVWRQVGGHLRRVETCQHSLTTWGIAYDHTAWVYTGGTANPHNPIHDSQDYRVYENQRWNPLSGYSSTALLPTDRYSWSDVTGRQRRSREHVRLLSSRRWSWVSEWLVDFHVLGGVDRDGWQYAVDFPAQYHGKKQFTDYVRRRRWYRRCAISTTGPWQELGHTKLLDVAIVLIDDADADIVNRAVEQQQCHDDSGISPDDVDDSRHVAIWALATGGQAMYRDGVTNHNPMGTKWEHVPTDQPLATITTGPYTRVWAVARNGCAYQRLGISPTCPHGDRWLCVEPPSNSSLLRQVSCGGGGDGVWGVDTAGRLHRWQEAEGCWGTSVVAVDHNTPGGCKQVAVTGGGTEVWAVTNEGVMVRREGVTGAGVGTGWDLGIAGNWQHITLKAFE